MLCAAPTAASAGTADRLALVSRGSFGEKPDAVAAAAASTATVLADSVPPAIGAWLASGNSSRWGAPVTIDQAAIPLKPE
jgi:hypothetical protein